MKIKLFAILAAVGLVASSLVIVSGLFAEDAKDSFIIQSSLFAKRTKANIEFTHKKHIDVHKIACNECHHV